MSTQDELVDEGNVHFHHNEHGMLVKCYHKCKQNWVGFLVGMTVTFPFEHLLWEHVWPFRLFTDWMRSL